MNDTAIGTANAAFDAPRGLIGLAERGLLPDWMIRAGIRRLCAQRLREERAADTTAAWSRFERCLDDLRAGPVATHTDAANAQHYELPPRFFQLCLGKHLKYSSCYFPTGCETLDQAEDKMLALYGERAELADGQDILELGCGWGSLTLWMAQKYPHSRITAVSNSKPQREFILARCRSLGLVNVEVITQDVNRLELPSARFDRCVSIEMFEHMRNYEILLGRIASWLRADAKLFVTASVPVRAGRRHAELPGASLVNITDDILARDARDMGRAEAPLRQAQDADLLDTSNLSIGAAVHSAIALVDARLKDRL